MLLSFQSSSINPFSPITPLIPSAQVSLGLPRFLLPGGRHFITSFGSLPSSILWTCPYHRSCLVLISSKRDLVTFIFCLTLRLLMSYIYIERLFLMFLDHTQRRSTVGRTPLDEWSARRRDLYLTTHDTHNRQISVPPVGFEPKIYIYIYGAPILDVSRSHTTTHHIR